MTRTIRRTLAKFFGFVIVFILDPLTFTGQRHWSSDRFAGGSTFLRLPESKLDEKTYSSHSKSLILTGKGSTGRRDLVPVGRARLH
ncbi:unnamed protein product [Hermetia illucens]|uniref:Uncharacterized protein n=1 Tax=Hermetia illucens TaxID=343691 RepID=A0A7R8YU43_HERIL|nr:unnamed protein product [Hermetia illucens]